MTNYIWIFNGPRNSFPSATFSTLEKAESWIKENKLSGTLTQYPIDIPVYDWAINNGYFKPKNELQKNAKAIANFSSASQEHFHYTDGE